MRTLLLTLTAASLLLTLVPAPAAAQDVCDVSSALCRQFFVIPVPEDVRSNEDGTYTVTYAMCNPFGWCETQQREITTPRPPPVDPQTCFPYNADALTNGCVQPGNQTVTLPAVVAQPRTVCVIGDQCVTTPDLPDAVTVPGVDGYVEATAACGVGAPCRVVLP